MDVAVRHYLPGRVRLRVPELCRKAALAESTLAWLRAQPGVTSARLNLACASLVVEFDRAREPLLQGILARLKAVSVKELAALVAGTKPAASANPPSLQPALPPKPAAKSAAVGPAKGDVPGLFSMRSPLGLPTLSLAMAFSANPFVIAVNMPLMLWNAIPIAKRAWRVWSNERRLNVDFLDTLAIAASVMQANPLAGSLVTWLIKLGDWIRDLRRASRGLSKAVEAAMGKCLKTAIGSLEPDSQSPPATWLSTAMVGVTGGVSGFFGVAALAVELPLTTTIMLRAIADIARHNGEDLARLDARLACLQVFALGARRTAVRTDLGYFAARALLTRLTGNTAAYLVERGAAELSGAMLGGPGGGDRVAVRHRGVGPYRCRRAAGGGRHRRRHRQRRLHEPFSRDRAGAFHRPPARTRIRRRDGPPALCRSRRAEPAGPQMMRRHQRRS
jgi:hypothetical protein